ncbi:MAG: outer membrane protein assembly factor BamA [Mariprofundaceae bacterium]
MGFVRQLIGFLLLLLLPMSGWAEDLSKATLMGKEIISLDVKGNRYTESAAILAGLESKAGKILNRRMVSHDIQKLYASGNYADLKVIATPSDDKVKLTFEVKENPFIIAYEMQGNEEVTYKDIKRKLKLKEGVVFSESKLRSDINTLRKGYLKEGFYQVEIEAIKDITADGSMKLTIEVHEGDVTHVRQIRFIGNEGFSDAELNEEVSARVSALMPWFKNQDVIDTQRFANDAQRLVQFYQNYGYLDVNIESSQLALTPDKKMFYLTFALHEGPIYQVSSVAVQGDLTPSKEKLLEAIELEAGATYSLRDLRTSIENMTLLVGDEGYAFNSVTPLFKRDVAGQTVAITFDIEKGREVYIERIKIEGNEKTDDGVARREMKIDESERYSATKMKKSKEALTRLGLFKDVRMSMPKGSADSRVNSHVKVEEDRTGSFVIGAGFSQVEKVMFRVKTSEKNLFGKGYGADVSADIGKVTQNFNVNLSDPYFLGSNVAASVNANKTQTKLNSAGVTANSLYTQNDYGGGVAFSVPVVEYVNYGISYNYKNSKLTDISPNASFLIKSQAGIQTTGELTQTLSYDSRDRFVGTTKGQNHFLSLAAAGLGGNNRFWEVGAGLKAYIPILEDFTLRTSLGGRVIQGYSGLDVPIYRRYSLGGVGSLRGFDYLGVSLRDPTTADPLGGDKQLTGSLDLFFPLPYIRTEGFRAVLFSDAGSVWGKERRSKAVEPFSVANIRVSAGFGLEWMSPVGPLTLAWSKALKKQKADVLRSFEFGLGTSF